MFRVQKWRDNLYAAMEQRERADGGAGGGHGGGLRVSRSVRRTGTVSGIDTATGSGQWDQSEQ